MVIYFIFIRFLLLKKDYTQHGLGMLACFHDVVTLYLDCKTMNVVPLALMMPKKGKIHGFTVALKHTCTVQNEFSNPSLWS